MPTLEQSYFFEICIYVSVLNFSFRIEEEYHDLYTLQRERMESDIKQLMVERDIWSSATYELSVKVVSSEINFFFG